VTRALGSSNWDRPFGLHAYPAAIRQSSGSWSRSSEEIRPHRHVCFTKHPKKGGFVHHHYAHPSRAPFFLSKFPLTLECIRGLILSYGENSSFGSTR
jgi:hypothetical protein